MKNLKYLFASSSSISDLKWLVEGWKERFLTPRSAKDKGLVLAVLYKDFSLFGSFEVSVRFLRKLLFSPDPGLGSRD